MCVKVIYYYDKYFQIVCTVDSNPNVSQATVKSVQIRGLSGYTELCQNTLV